MRYFFFFTKRNLNKFNNTKSNINNAHHLNFISAYKDAFRFEDLIAGKIAAGWLPHV